MKKTLVALLAAAAVVVGLAGCAESTASAGDGQIVREDLPEIHSSDQQLAELEGGVTEDEYLAAFTRFETCMDDAGYPLVSVEHKDYLVTYSMLAEAYDSGDHDRCYLREFQQVDEQWQLLNQDKSVANRAYQACLTEAGVTPKSSAKEVWEQVQEAGLDPAECARQFEPAK